MIADLNPYPAMKESGIEWLGKVPKHWEVERGKWLFRKMERPVQDCDEHITCFRDGTVTLRKNRRVRGFTESLKEIGYQGIRRGDLVIHNMDAFAGAIGVSDSDGKGTPVYSVCRPEPNVNTKYYAFVLREMARNRWIQALAKGIRERSTDFRFEGFSLQRVPFPPLHEQSDIVRFLNHADRRIRRYIHAKQKLIALLEEQKQAIILQAVTGRIDVRTGRPYPADKPSGVKWLGKVPEHWEVRRIGSFSKIGNGSTPSRSNSAYWSGGKIPWLNSSSVNQGTITRTDQFVTDAALRECHLPRVPADSVLVGITGQGKTRGTAAILAIEATINQHMAYITPNKDRVLSQFLRMCLGAAYIELRAISVASGSTKGALTCEDIKSFSVVLPPKREQEALLFTIGRELESVNRYNSIVCRQITLLRGYRTRLIADVVTGKLDVREAAARLPEVDPLAEEHTGDTVHGEAGSNLQE